LVELSGVFDRLDRLGAGAEGKVTEMR